MRLTGLHISSCSDDGAPLNVNRNVVPVMVHGGHDLRRIEAENRAKLAAAKMLCAFDPQRLCKVGATSQDEMPYKCLINDHCRFVGLNHALGNVLESLFFSRVHLE